MTQPGLIKRDRTMCWTNQLKGEIGDHDVPDAQYILNLLDGQGLIFFVIDNSDGRGLWLQEISWQAPHIVLLDMSVEFVEIV